MPEDDDDLFQIQIIHQVNPALKRYMSHHFNNSLNVILGRLELAIAAFDDPKTKEALRNHIYGIQSAALHLQSDLRKAGI